MKYLIIFLTLMVSMSCDKSDTKIINSDSGVTLSSSRLAALEKPMLSIRWSEKLFSLNSRKNQMEVLNEIQSKLLKAGLYIISTEETDWKNANIKVGSFLDNNSNYDYLPELKQSVALLMLLQTNLLKDPSEAAQNTVVRNLNYLKEGGSDAIAVVHYVFKNYGKLINKNTKRDIAQSVIKVYNQNRGSKKLSKEEREEMAKVNTDLLSRIQDIENANDLALLELSKY